MRSSRVLRQAGGVAFALLLAGAADAGGDSATLRVGPHVFEVEVAATPRARQRGLMGRTHLAADRGMLFVFEQPGRHCFWMRDTPLPLSIAFIDAAGRIANLADMAPRSETPHCPKREVRYALEVRQGEFRRRGIQPQMRVDGLPR
ncbi:exported protein [Thiobacillus denitrificans ATCC 25259]|uniref:Exported protein n=1 Tax=Thiobacillus denitrificans (strain ATCC 25259 / T1) TaxID=292415 RepID=Q3SFJ3_THIDA|nr:DUF192 domain-containing protein [Thiobacillus denitrificans]AAZ98616.1 exported protein [Thiobacillus denitrificans ATCC 25259]